MAQYETDLAYVQAAAFSAFMAGATRRDSRNRRTIETFRSVDGSAYRRMREVHEVAARVARPFAPAGRVFKEWISVPKPDRERWSALLREGLMFATR